MMMVLGIVILLVVFTIIGINSLSVKRNQTDFAFSTIDVLLKKRSDLIPNLVETVRGYAEHEQKLYGHIAEMRSQALRNRSNLGRRFEAETGLSQDLQQILFLSENYPELKADSHFRRLQVQLVDIENQIAAARRFFNSAVNDYNDAVESFPTSVFASMMGMEEKAYFQAEAADRYSPSVSMHTDKMPVDSIQEEEAVYGRI